MNQQKSKVDVLGSLMNLKGTEKSSFCIFFGAFTTEQQRKPRPWSRVSSGQSSLPRASSTTPGTVSAQTLPWWCRGFSSGSSASPTSVQPTKKATNTRRTKTVRWKKCCVIVLTTSTGIRRTHLVSDLISDAIAPHWADVTAQTRGGDAAWRGHQNVALLGPFGVRQHLVHEEERHVRGLAAARGPADDCDIIVAHGTEDLQYNKNFSEK